MFTGVIHELEVPPCCRLMQTCKGSGGMQLLCC